MYININGYRHKTGIPRVYTINTDYTLDVDMGYVVFLVDTSLSDVTLTLPSTGTIDCFVIKKISASNALVITPPTGTIDGGSTINILRQYESITLVSDSSNWNII